MRTAEKAREILNGCPFSGCVDDRHHLLHMILDELDGFCEPVCAIRMQYFQYTL